MPTDVRCPHPHPAPVDRRADRQRLPLTPLALGAASCLLGQVLQAQSPGVRLSNTRADAWSNPSGLGVFVDLDASPRLDVRLSFDVARGSLGSTTVRAASLSAPFAVARRPERQLRLVPGVQVTNVAGGPAEGMSVGAELGMEARLTPAASGRLEWVGGVTAGTNRSLGIEADRVGRARSYLRLSLGLRFRLSVREYTGRAPEG